MPYKWLALVTLCFGVFVVSMDVSIVNIALPALSDEFDLGPDTVVWATLVFNLASTGLALTAGRIGDLYGRKRMFVLGWAIFTLGLMLSAAAPTFGLLIAARAVNTIGAAMTLSTSTAILAEVFPASERGRALGIYSSSVGAGLACGPVLGGFLVDVFDWRAIFWVRLPVALGAIFLSQRILKPTLAVPGKASIDVGGAVTLFVALAAAVVACNRGQSWGWSSPAILGLVTVSAASFVTFIRIEKAVERPILELSLFRNRLFSGSLLAMALSFVGQVAVSFLVPFYLIRVRGYSASHSGLVMMTVPVMMLGLAPLSGWLYDRYGSRLQVSAGPLVGCIGIASLSFVDGSTPIILVILPLVAVGIGMALFGPPNNTGIIASVPSTHLGAAAGGMATARSLGSVIGLTLSSAIFVTIAAHSAGVAVDGVRTETLPLDAQLDGIRTALRVGACVSLLAVGASFLRPSRAATVAPGVIVRESSQASAAGATD